MTGLSMQCERGQYSQSTIHYNVGSRFPKLAKLIAFAVFAGTALCPALRAQSNGDPGAPNMSGVTDVTPGWKYLLRNDDLVMLQVTPGTNGAVTTSLVSMDTSNSALSGTQQNVTINTANLTVDPTNSIVAAEASGRMFNTNTDTVAVLSATLLGWNFALANSTGVQSSSDLGATFPPYGTVYTQVVMGDFNGDGLADPVAFYENTNFNATPEVQWAMNALTAVDPTKPWKLYEGPALGGNTTALTAPVAGTIVVGDFNGDGRDEIAALLNDYQTVAFYSVDPNTFAITQTTTAKLTANLSSGNFAMTMVPGQVALAAGKFRQCGANGNQCQANGVTNADIVVFGQISKIDNQDATFGYSVIPVKITTASSGPFTAAVVPMPNATQQQPFFRFPNYHGAFGALAQAAPLAHWPQQTDQQLVLGIKTENGASYIEIGSFLPDDGSLDTFDWESETEREYACCYDHLENMWVGNFDHQNKDAQKTHNAGWQIETYELVGGGIYSYEPHILIFNVNVPSTLTPGSKHTDWLKDQQQSDNTSGIPLQNPHVPSLSFLVPSDMQGRSLRLGAPTIVRIPTQTQPDLILAIPPMHVDYIAPNNQNLAKDNQGCTNATTPCVVNISVQPSVPPSEGQGFASSFNFTSSSNSSSKRSSTTSWGISTKTTVGESSTFNDGLENASESIQDTTKTAHDQTVKKTYGTYKGITQTLSATTGFSDFLYFTQKAINVYYYPVLGCETASAGECWGATSNEPMYVQFSVPDQVRYSSVDGLNQDWYQPVHEPGNILSYPWSLAQLQGQFTEQVNPLTGSATCMAIGTSTQSYSTQWTTGQSQDSSSGATNSFSNEFSMSSSIGAGVKGVDSADLNFSFDVAGSTSLNTLNESTTSMSTSKSISVNVPQFGDAGKYSDYAFGAYIFGLKNTQNPASEDACTAGQTPDKDNCTAVTDPDTGKPIDVAGTGPLFVGFLADPISSVNPNNTSLGCSGNDSWWQTIYTKPDVALNHPGRWNWNKAQRLATFVKANSTNIIEDDYFYLMKGFFIAKKGNTTGPNLAQALPSDPLTLTARVYNYSLATTTAPVHVRFYGQLYCTSSGSSETSCRSGGTTCTTPGLCGNSFQIGSDQTIPTIAGFKADGNEANWSHASLDFLPSNYAATKAGNAYVVFWVVAWMEDGSGNVVAEMPGHGLTSVPGANLTQITQVPIQPYSNNVGLYGVHQRFYICPPSGCDQQQNASLGATQSNGSLKSITISANPKMLLEQRAKLSATLQATGGSVGPVNIAYYDGNPTRGGTLLDVQQIQHMDPSATYAHRTFFTPETCGTHTLYASAWAGNSSEIQASSSTSVSIDSVDFMQALINSTQTANITDTQLSSSLLALLNTALQDFQQGQTDAGNIVLSAYVQQLALASGSGITVPVVNQLTGQAGVLFGCGATGFSLVVSPSSATASAGSPASYALALTPVGGFTGKVSLACSGVPQGVDCSFSSRSVALDGSSQSRVTITVRTGGSVSAAGFAGLPPSGSSVKIQWIVMLLLAALAIACLQRARLRQTILGCAIALVVLSGMSGCGSGDSGDTALAPGTYRFILQATSGETVRNRVLTLVVK